MNITNKSPKAELSTFCNWVEVLPYSELIIIKENAYAKN